MPSSGTLTPGPTYGDKVKLDTKREAGTSGPLVQKTPAGRPSQQLRVPVTPVVAAGEPTFTPVVPESERELMGNYARALRFVQYWSERAAEAVGAGMENVYLRVAQDNAKEAAIALYRGTPNL